MRDLDEAAAHAVGRLPGRSGTTDVVDATVVTIATVEQASVLTADPRHIARLAGAIGADLDVREV